MDSGDWMSPGEHILDLNPGNWQQTGCLVAFFASSFKLPVWGSLM